MTYAKIVMINQYQITTPFMWVSYSAHYIRLSYWIWKRKCVVPTTTATPGQRYKRIVTSVLATAPQEGYTITTKSKKRTGQRIRHRAAQRTY